MADETKHILYLYGRTNVFVIITQRYSYHIILFLYFRPVYLCKCSCLLFMYSCCSLYAFNETAVASQNALPTRLTNQLLIHFHAYFQSILCFDRLLVFLPLYFYSLTIVIITTINFVYFKLKFSTIYV